MAGAASADIAANANVINLTAPQSASAVRTLSHTAGDAQARPLGDLYSAEALVQDGASAFFLDDGAFDHVFDGAAEFGGVSSTAAGASFVYNEALFDNGDGTFTAVSQAFHVDDATGGLVDWVPAGVTGPAGPFTAWRFDAGAPAAPNPIDIALGAGESIVVTEVLSFLTDTAGGSLGAFDITGGANDFTTTTSLGGIALIGLGGADIAGFGVGSLGLQWTYEIVPAPASAALFGLGGLAAARRRR